MRFAVARAAAAAALGLAGAAAPAGGPASGSPATPPAAEIAPSAVKGADPALLQTARGIADRVASIVRASPPEPLLALRGDLGTRAAGAQARASRLLPAAVAAARGRAWEDIGLGGASGPGELVAALAADLDGITLDADSRRVVVDPGRLKDDEPKGGPEADAAASLLLTTGVAPDETVLGHYAAHVILDGPPIAGPITTDALLARWALSEGAANVGALSLLFGGAGLEKEVVSGVVRPEDALAGRLVSPVLRSASPAVASLLEFVYLDGFAQAAALVRAGDFPRLAAERKLRRTTRDVLHLDRPAASAATIPAPGGADAEGLELLDTDTLGEQGIVTLVSLVTGKDNLGLIAGDGWAGDALFRLEPSGPAGGGVTLWSIRFLTETDAKDMVYALTRCLEARFPGEKPVDEPDGRSVLARSDRVFRIGRSVTEVSFRVASPSWDAKFEKPATPKEPQGRPRKRK